MSRGIISILLVAFLAVLRLTCLCADSFASNESPSGSSVSHHCCGDDTTTPDSTHHTSHEHSNGCAHCGTLVAISNQDFKTPVLKVETQTLQFVPVALFKFIRGHLDVNFRPNAYSIFERAAGPPQISLLEQSCSLLI